MREFAFQLFKFVEESKKYLTFKLPNNSEKTFSEKILISNNTRSTGICGVYILITLFQLIFQNIKEIPYGNVTLAYSNLTYINIMMIIICVTYLLIINFVSIKRQINKINIYTSLLVTFIFLVQILNTLTSINAQLYRGDITAFIITMFMFSIGSIIKPSKSITIYIINYILLVLGLIFSHIFRFRLYANIFNAFITMIFAILLSIINYYSAVKNFIQKNELMNKAKELEDYKNHLEELVKDRTLDLMEANAKLLEEVQIRHRAELDAIHSNMKYKEKERLLNKAVEYEKIRTEFFANISHELRTPLNVIFCAQQMIDVIVKNNYLQEADQYKTSKYLGTIKQNSFRLLRLINNLIDITKMDAGYFEVTLSNNDIVKIVEDITLSVVEYAENKNINIVFDTEIEEKIIACDPDKIERIILNLLSNAIKFTPVDGSIYVNIYARKYNIIISVKDTGIGIDKNMHSLIFDRFVQVDKSISRGTEGSGIGLSLVRSLVEMHNGKISVKSNLGEGSEFIIELPKIKVKNSNAKMGNYNVFENKKNIEMIHVEFSDIYF